MGRRAWYGAAPAYPLGDSLAVELPALTRAALVRIQVPQPNRIPPAIEETLGFAEAKPHRECLEATLVGTIPPADRLSGQLDPWRPLRQGAESNLGVQARKRCTNADMRSTSEYQLRIRLSRDVERIWIVKSCRVAIDRADQANGRRSGGNAESIAAWRTARGARNRVVVDSPTV